MINGATNGVFLDDRRFWPILECAQALRVPIYLHPSKPQPAVMKAYFEGYEEIALAPWGFGIETGAHFLRLLLGGGFGAVCNLTVILAHLVAGLAFIVYRLTHQ